MELARNEADLQRYSQIRDEIHDLIQIIPQEVKKLTETNKRMLAHFDVFKTLSSEVKEHIHEEINTATKDIAESTSQKLIASTEERLRNVMDSLEKTFQTTENRLIKIQQANHKKGHLKTTVLFLCFLLTGFGIGHLIPSKTQPIFSKEMLTTYQWGKALKNTWPRLSVQDRDKLKNLLHSKD